MSGKIQEKQVKNEHRSAGSYLVGFALSLILTFAAYIPVVIHQNSYHESLSHGFLIPYVLVIATVQLVVQLLFFLHIGQEKGPRYILVVFLSTVFLVLLIVIASIWIMGHLNYNMTPQQIENYVQSQDGF